jgi:hypothetical protein
MGQFEMTRRAAIGYFEVAQCWQLLRLAAVQA